MTFEKPVRIILQGISAVVKRRSALLKAFFLPLVIYLVLLVLLQSSIESLGVQRYTILQLVGGLLSFLVYVVVSVSTHRAIILNERASSFKILKSIGAKEWQFSLACFEAIFYCLPCLIFLVIPHVGEYIVTAVSAYIVSRISLIFPSIAIDVPMNAGASWRATEKYQVTMFFVVFLFSLFFTLLEWLLSRVGVPNIFIEIFSLLTIVFLVAALSEAYKTIMSNTEV